MSNDIFFSIVFDRKMSRFNLSMDIITYNPYSDKVTAAV